MKYSFLLIATLFIASCSNTETAVTEAQQKEFRTMAQAYQTAYNGGGANCDQITKAFDENVKMSEIQFGQFINYPYEVIIAYCPHLPKKQVIETTSEQRLLTPTLGYDYVSQLYLRQNKTDTIRETSSTIWENKNGQWKIIQMNNSLAQSCD